MFFYDPTFVLLIPALLLAFWAQIKVSTTFSRYSRVRSLTGYTGSQLAMRLLDYAGIYDVRVEPTPGHLTDHYDPRTKVVRLSASTYASSSVAALGVVAHEIGHAIQHAQKHPLLVFRNVLAPVAGFGSSLAWILFLMGLIFAIPALWQFGILLFSLAVLFSLVTLPVEYDASRKAIKLLRENILMSEEELVAVKKVLSAAALTYVAATAMSILQLLRMLILAGAFGRRD
ncbi:zinc metallopeptidase [Pseudothermotoga thermarum]|uniref:Peptidase membrane zinc metallopeptidase n=1 Tax=Pseudothermotoga thermarum DSM 5069 TaxID=688269 RepID=F7YTS7_9THEM|nr:zinc metallopeptidase [Pseudothermotoga thermarum]AEH51372.1 peptidase membrane zinc metallopeptidase [Pseudothermotoga thermarum DSM 5069]